MRCRSLLIASVLALLAAAPATQPVQAYRDKFAVADKLDVTAVAVDDGSAADGPVVTTMTCRLRADGTYRFTFEPYGKAGEPRTLTVALPAPSPRFRSVRPGGIHGGPPLRRGDPTVVRDAHDPAVVTVTWTHIDSAGQPSRSGFELAKVECVPATTQP